MRTLLRASGGVLIAVGILVMVFSGNLSEKSKPQNVQLGYVIDGKVVMSDKTGQIGGNEQAQEDADSLHTLGIMFSVFGGCMLVASFFTEKK